MKVLVVNGSPRANSNSKALAEAFAEGAREAGHELKVVDVGDMMINGCLGCEYCHSKGEGKCIQQDDMQKLYDAVNEADMIMFTSPIYYWSFSGQLQSFITRLYAGYKPAKAQKYAVVLSSMSPGVYDAPLSQLKSMMRYWSMELDAEFCFNGTNQLTEENLSKLREYGRNI